LVVQACAVLAQNSTLARLEAVLALPPHATASALSELELAGLIASEEGRVGCRHDLIADAVMRGIGATLGSYIHRRCAVVLDQELRSSPAASLAWDCALHWDAAAESARALDLTGLIVDQLLSLGLPRAAADLCERAERHCKNAQQHSDRLLRLSRARYRLYEWDGVIQALEKRNAIRQDRKFPRLRYAEDEIALFEARFFRDYDGRVLRRALQRVTDTRAPVLHRLQMAVVALIVADNRGKRSEATRILEIVELIEPVTPQDDAEKSRARLVYHSAFGEVDVAVAAAKCVVDNERLLARSASLMRSLRWASTALKLANDTTGAEAALRESYQLASRVSLQIEMWQAALYLQDLAIDCEDLHLAHEWTRISLELERAISPASARSANSAYLLSRIALMDGDMKGARAFLDYARAQDRSILRTRARESLLALDVLLRIKAGGTAPRQLVSRLRRLHMLTRGSGVRDFETGALIGGLLRIGERSDAHALLAEYVRVRRTRLEPHSTLREVHAILS
jgi:hypothetical protein